MQENVKRNSLEGGKKLNTVQEICLKIRVFDSIHFFINTNYNATQLHIASKVFEKNRIQFQIDFFFKNFSPPVTSLLTITNDSIFTINIY